MRKLLRLVAALVSVAVFASLAVGCNTNVSAVPAADTQQAATGEQAAPAPAPALLPPDAFAITIESIGHWHIFNAKKLQFLVKEAASGQGKAGPISSSRSHAAAPRRSLSAV